MGVQKVESDSEFGGERRRHFVRAILRDLHALEHMLRSGAIEEGVTRIGAEQEMFLIDRDGHPALAAMKAMEVIQSPHFTTELGLFQLEMNADPHVLGGDCFRRLEFQIAELLTHFRTKLAPFGVGCVLTGILPTLRKSDLGLDGMVPSPRYLALNRALTELRGGTYEITIKGVDELRIQHDSVMLEACNASFQVHLQVGASDFARQFNLALALAGPTLACATNSPVLFGRRLWAETRIALFQQSVDTRRPGANRDLSPRVTFGDRWVRRSVLELYREDVTRFRTLVGTELDEDPIAALKAGRVPQLKALRLHNGTVYRWIRACYGITDGKPHLRIENRVLPSGPSVLDEVANGAFWIGLMRGLGKSVEDVTQRMEFEHAQSNFLAAARQGMGADFIWMDGEEVSAKTLIEERLLPIAREGLLDSGVDVADVERYLGTIERRVNTGRTGSRWILFSLAAMKDKGTLGERLNALTNATVARQVAGLPVDQWEPAQREEGGGWKHNYLRVEQFMTTDLVTVHEEDPVDLVANLMEWHRIRHVLVEDYEHRLIGIVSYRALLRLLTRHRPGEPDTSMIPVSEIVKRDPVTIGPDTTTQRAIEIMRNYRVGCLPIVQHGRLVGLVTEHDFTEIAGQLLDQKLSE
jgi:CBS domain-containing protein/gamma-glutamylcysteine synthetase